MMKVLVVDDDKSTLLMLRLLLTQAGCRITCAGDATEALTALQETRFDWMVVDGQIPPIDGFQLADKAKEMQPQLQVVMISGLYGPEDISGHPISKLFQKPVDTDALVSHMRGLGGSSPPSHASS